VRRLLTAIGICAAIGCGLDVGGGLDPAVASSTDGGPEGSAMLPDLDAAADGFDAPDIDGAMDAALLDAEGMRPDAGVTFVPSHIQPVYSLTAPNVMLSRDTVVDTTARTVQDSTQVAPVPLMNMKTSDGIAIWSVGAFTLQAGSRLTVIGPQPLVVVASSTVEIDGHIDASGSGSTPGPGGFAAASGSKLIGGSGGGSGGGFGTAPCTDATRGRGGVGGGAVQFSAVGFISISGTFDLGGGGGSGGCADNGSANDYRGGGGGGAAGMLVFESATSIQVNSFAEIVAAGGGGGEGGESNGNGMDVFPDKPTWPAPPSAAWAAAATAATVDGRATATPRFLSAASVTRASAAVAALQVASSSARAARLRSSSPGRPWLRCASISHSERRDVAYLSRVLHHATRST
jgi:hypothetical protein